jgi:hypothetical protein
MLRGEMQGESGRYRKNKATLRGGASMLRGEMQGERLMQTLEEEREEK